MKFKTTLEAEAFAHKIGASHLVNFDGNYQFLCELKNKTPICFGSNILVDAIYNQYTEEWVAWNNVEFMGLVAMCSKAVKVEMKLVDLEDLEEIDKAEFAVEQLKELLK